MEVAGGHYNVICRGIDRPQVFCDLADHQKFVQVLGEVATFFGWRVHAWVLMGNRFHLLLQTTGANLSRSMQRFSQQCQVSRCDPVSNPVSNPVSTTQRC